MTEVLLSFDTEDYINPEAEKGVMRLAQTLDGQGVRGCLCVVGEVANVWRERGSRHVIEALRPHEIDVHTWRHSWHPNIVEYSEDEDWDRSLARLLREERYAIDLVMDVCGRQRPWAFVKPGNSFSAQAIHGSTLLGVPIFGDSFLDADRGRGLWYCNALNLNYDYSLERLFDRGLGAFEAQFDEWATWERLILYAHPCQLVLGAFWDGQNMFHHNPPTWGDWVRAPRRPAAQVEHFFHDLDRLLARMRAHGGFEFVTYEHVWQKHAAAVHRRLDREELPALLATASAELAPQVASAGDTWSPAELLAAAVHVLSGRPDPIQAWGVMGPTDDPEAGSDVTARGRVDLPVASLVDLAKDLEPVTYLPAEASVDGVSLGTGDLFRALAAAVAGAERVALLPGPQLPTLARRGNLATHRTSGQWCHPAEWTSERVDARLRWQSWTIRPVKP